MPWATAARGEELRILQQTELPQLRVLGTFGDNTLTGFAAFRTRPSSVTLEYIAVAPERQRAGNGAPLICTIRQNHADKVTRTEIDDDAVGFYRALSFSVTRAIAPRRPGQPRYACNLRVIGRNGTVDDGEAWCEGTPSG